MTLYLEDRFVKELKYPYDKSEVSGLQVSSVIKCLESYKQFSCRYNFPLCNPETGDTYPICQEECNQYFENCGMDIG